MNYLLNIHLIPTRFMSFFQVLIYYLIAAFILLTFVFIFNKLYNKINNHFNFRKIWSIILYAALILISAFLTYFILLTSRDLLNDGKITDIFILNKKNETRLVVWFTRLERSWDGYFSPFQRLKSFDINNGRQLGKQNLVRRYFHSSYCIYGPFDDKAWGYGEKTGIHLLDLFQPKILFTEEDILRKNPQLGSLIQIAPDDNNSVYDPASNGLYIVDVKGIMYRIDPDLNAVFAGDLKKEKDEYNQNYLPRWIIERIKNSEGKIVHAHDKQISKNYKPFFYPSIIDWYGNYRNKDKIWITHWSSNEKNSDRLISYIKDDGREINRINLKKIFNNNDVKPYSMLFHNGECYIFITNEGYTLSALRTDVEKGNVLSRIDYFQ